MSYLRNNKVLLLIIAALLIVNFGLLFYGVRKKGHGDRPRKGDPKEWAIEKLKKEIGFNQEQIASYEDLRTKHFDSLKTMFDELRMAKDSFFNLLYQPQISDSVINLYAAKVCNKQEAIDMKMLRHFRNLRALATDEQKPKIDSFLQSITQRMSGGGRHGPGPDKDKAKDKK